jgi:hypothetical protein
MTWRTRGVRCTRPRQGDRLAGGQLAPPLADLIETCTHPLDFLVGRRSIAAPPCAHAAIDQLFGARELSAVFPGETLAAATQLAVDDAVGAMKRRRVAASRELAEDPKRDAALTLDDEVREIMWEQRVIARSRMHR